MAGGAKSLAQIAAWTRLRSEPALEPALRIVDPHHHFALDGANRYLFDELAADLNGGHRIEATVYVQTGQTMYRRSGPPEMRCVGEVEFANGMAALGESGALGSTRICAGIVGYADLRLGGAVAPVLDALVAAGNGRLRGIRHNLIWDPVNEGHHTAQFRHTALDGGFRAGLREVARRGLSFDAWIFYTQLDELADLLRAFPELPVVLNHVGGILGVGHHAGRREEIFGIWRERLRTLAQYPNLTVKVGGFGMPRCGWDFHTRALPPTSQELADAWRPYVETCIGLFGPQRCMFESNFPVDMGSAGYVTIWNAFKRITAGMGAGEKAALYRDAAVRAYRLGLPA